MLDSKKTIGIIGIGLMGHAIATNILKAGWPIIFLDHQGNQPSEDLIAMGALACKSPKDVASKSAAIILCVTGTPQVEEVMNSPNGVLKGIQNGAIVIDCSTSMPASSEKIATLVQNSGGQFIDAPMTRTPKEAKQGRLNLIVGGSKDVFETCLPLLQSFAENIVHAGPIGSGHKLKLLHNFVSLGFAELLSEAAACSNKAGIDKDIFVNVLKQGGGAGIVLDRLEPYILNGDDKGIQFTLGNACKDLDYYCAMSEALGAKADSAKAIKSVFEDYTSKGASKRYIPELIQLMTKST